MTSKGQTAFSSAKTFKLADAQTIKVLFFASKKQLLKRQFAYP
jgi:hypothetical protein